MHQILPGVYHWSSFHEGIGQRVHSYFIEAVTPPCLVDAMGADKTLEWLKNHAAPVRERCHDAVAGSATTKAGF